MTWPWWIAMATNFSLALILLVRYVSAGQEEHLIESLKSVKETLLSTMSLLRPF